MSQESCDSLHRHCQKKIKKKNPLKTEHGEYQELVWVFIPFCMFRKKQMETMSTYIILHSLVDCRLISAISMERSSCWGQLTTHQNWFTSWKTPSKHHHFNAWFKGKSAKQKVFPVRGVATERKRVVEPRSLTSFNAADEESFSQLFFLRRILVLTLIEDPINVSPVKPPWRVSGTSRDFPAISIWHGQASHRLTTWGVEPPFANQLWSWSMLQMSKIFYQTSGLNMECRMY